jgi:hypothetical protein
MQRNSIVDQIYQENLELLEFLKENNEVSFMAQFNTVSTKTLLLSAASYFEHEICKIIQDFIERKTQGNECIVSIVKQKVIERQYHTYFSWKDWNTGNVNTFLRLFGETFQQRRSSEIKADIKLKSAVIAFLELGNERNKLVHQNFADYSIEKTAEEVYELYQKATLFIDFLDTHFNEL